MQYTISVQPTPNPNALKFVLNVLVKTKDSIVYRQLSDCGANKMAGGLLRLDHVVEVYFASNFVTVTQNGDGDWDAIEIQVKHIILSHIQSHDPEIKPVVAEASVRPAASGDLAKIEAILESTIRPALQRDGGDLTLLSLDGKVLTIQYEGACGGCPHSSMGTLYAIQNILRDQFDPEIVVEMA